MNVNLLVWFLVSITSQLVCCLIDDVKPLLSLRDRDRIIEVTDENYESLMGGVKGYSTVLYITMRGELNGKACDMCNEFEETLRQASNQIYYQYPDLNVLFYIADVGVNKKLAQDLKLKFIPHLLVYPPATDNSFKWSTSQFYQYELTERVVKELMALANFLGKTLNILIKINEPFKYDEFIFYFGTSMLVFIILKKIILPRVNNKSKFAMAVFSFTVIFLSITGYKFTEIKGIPFIARNDKGEIMYFSGGMNWQFGIEIFTVSTMYLVLGLQTLLLICLPKLSVNENVKFISCLFLTVSIFYSFSYYISCFMIKSPGYAFSF
ncbi:hypothetical protein Kpol_1004p40 [Vanderwaltozyma polyspora DSM 70294]|uniref:Uncharacterized protein n=1 Tax=Vanderwaltozyma polyspora (strain ATCC 22028 / DSM 70294 / BCRC 21397 / CBS 2163 / NBRC 10782 / NRRL Y-8283 / UCD 57-17) TaxID=436907 RepID=A7TJ96_VANPO|nr:uncharacterized protein Kpol_1004p40 [Vanderwaltozyma polyspora DSM 70294]EDO17665.1 hypothetical protein Kpol_1004p40 [Vanderwaltozyma polyspora DSM 70294]